MAHFESAIRGKRGVVVPGATVSVFDAGTQDLADLFSDDGLTVPIDNPTTSDDCGIVNFYVLAGSYDILVQRFDIEDRLREDVEIITSADSGNPTGAASGDLGGNYPAPTVDGISGKAIVNSPIADGEVVRYFSGTDDLAWSSASASSDPTELVLTAGQFRDPSLGPSVAATDGHLLLLAGGVQETNYICTTKLPPSYYGVNLTFEVMIQSAANAGDARLVFGVENTHLANTPSNAVTQSIAAFGSPQLLSLSTTLNTAGTSFDGMVHIVIGRDPGHIDDTLSFAADVFFVRIIPT